MVATQWLGPSMLSYLSVFKTQVNILRNARIPCQFPYTVDHFTVNLCCRPSICEFVDMIFHLLVPRQDGGPPSMPQRSPEYMTENLAPRLLAVEGSLFVLSTTTIIMRLYVRIFMLKTLGWDGK